MGSMGGMPLGQMEWTAAQESGRAPQSVASEPMGPQSCSRKDLNSADI